MNLHANLAPSTARVSDHAVQLESPGVSHVRSTRWQFADPGHSAPETLRLVIDDEQETRWLYEPESARLTLLGVQSEGKLTATAMFPMPFAQVSNMYRKPQVKGGGGGDGGGRGGNEGGSGDGGGCGGNGGAGES